MKCNACGHTEDDDTNKDRFLIMEQVDVRRSIKGQLSMYNDEVHGRLYACPKCGTVKLDCMFVKGEE